MRPIEPMRVVAAAAIVVFLVLPQAAAADSNDPGGSSAIGQYVEQIPTSSGSATPHSGGATTTALPQNVARDIRTGGGKDAELLESIATSSAYGAPKPTVDSKQTGSHPAVTASRLAIGQSSGDGTAAFVWVLAGLVVVSAVIAGFALGAGRRAQART